MLKICQAETSEHRDHVRALFWEYLQWANAMVGREFGITFDIETMLEHDMDELSKFFPPSGRLLLAEHDNEVAGIVCLRKLGDDTGEVKRMYVRPAYRGKGIGRALVEALLAGAGHTGYTRVRLDSAKFMLAAHSLYRSLGFEEITAYDGSEVPLEFQAHWIFMEKTLT